MKQKFLIIEYDRDVNEWLDSGWEVVSVTSENVSISDGNSGRMRGRFAVVIQYNPNNTNNTKSDD